MRVFLAYCCPHGELVDIIGIFSTKEIAEKATKNWIEEAGGYNKKYTRFSACPIIEEYELDSEFTTKGEEK